jgi:branched-chain amino acid aminotransferase
MKEAFFKGKLVPFSEAKIGIMTHAFNYGTGVFEGIRGYWNPEKKQMYLFRLGEHFERLERSCKILMISLKYSAEELCKITVELAKHNGYKEDVYIRPLAYKSSEVIGLGLTGLQDDLTIFLAPFGEYLDVSKGIRVCTSTWWRIEDNCIPARAKITGAYVNSSLAKAEAIENGFAEALMFSSDGHLSEGTGENAFIMRHGKLITPPFSDNILEGITRACVVELIQNELGIEVVERSIDRTELYIADEMFLCGTGAQISPVVEIDRRLVGDGKVGQVTKKLQKIYFDAVKGNNPKYSSWLTPVY